MVDEFECDKAGARDVVEFLKTRALREQAENLSTTFLFISGSPQRVDGFATLSATSVHAPRRLRERIGKEFIPAAAIDYVAVANHRSGQGLGLRIFAWIQNRILPLNDRIGVRLIFLGVRGRNWDAYVRYATKWDLKALPVRLVRVDAFGADRIETRDAPDAMKARPPWLLDEDLIHMYWDFVEHLGAHHPQGDSFLTRVFARIGVGQQLP